MDYYGQQDNSNFFGSTIDPNAANFGNPMNSANMNQGFGINPALLTPSYQAPYRPHVALQAGYNPYGSPSFSGAAYNAFGPGKDPTWGNPHDSMQPSVQSMASKPFDAMAWAGQNVALPAAMYSATGRIMGPLTSPNWSMGTIFRGAQPLSSAWSGAGMASRAGGNFGMGLARGLGMGAGGAETLGALGALTTGVIAPFVAGYAATQGVNHLIFDQYVSSRQNANNLHRNFSNVYMGDGGGDAITGRGLSYSQSAKIGTQISSLGNNDRMFSQSDYSQIFDMSSRAGLYDNVKSNGIVKRTKDIAEQIKMIVAISKDPSVQSAIEQLSSLNLAGASVAGGRSSVAAGAYQQLGGLAAQAGMSVQRVMSGVGAQGQYMYQANGMTPYLGQLAAANSLAGFSAAQRSGLMSSAALARSGGIEGAAQGSLTAQIMSAQTPYAMMGSYNRIIGGAGGNAVGGPNQSVVGTIGAFGANVSRDPLSAMGNMALYGQAAAGADMAVQGSSAPENQAISILKSMGQAPRGRGGRYTPEQLAAVMTQHMGMPASNVRDYLSNRASESDPGSNAIRAGAVRGNALEQARAQMNQSGSGGGAFDTLTRNVSRLGGAVMDNAASSLVNPVVRAGGSAGDVINKVADWWGFSSLNDHKTSGDIFSNDSKTSVRVLDLDKIDGGRSRGRYFGIFNNTGVGTEEATDVLKNINKLARSGNSNAQDFVAATSNSSRYAALEKIAASDFGSLGDSGARLSTSGGIAGMTKATVADNLDFVSQMVSSNQATRLESTSNTGRTDFLNAASSIIDTGDRRSSHNKTTTMGLAELHLAGAAQELARIQEEKGLSNTETLALAKKDKRFGALLRYSGGESATATSLVTKVESLQKGAIVGGLVGTSSRVFGDLTSDSISSMNGEQDTKYLKSLGNVYDVTSPNKRSVDSMSHADIQAYDKNTLNTGKSLRDLQDAFISNKVDYSTLKENMGKIDSATEFRLGVDKFVEGVEKFTGKPTEKENYRKPGNPMSAGANDTTNKTQSGSGWR